MLFLVLILITLTSLIVFIVQFVRARRGGSRNRRGGWWEGPWDDDDRGR